MRSTRYRARRDGRSAPRRADSAPRRIEGGRSRHLTSRAAGFSARPAGSGWDRRDPGAGASSVPVSTFWAAFVDPDSPAACTSVNIGHGTHLNPTVAAIRAITEAAQARLTFIHGAREDLTPEAYEFSGVHERLRSFFEVQRGDLEWSAIVDRSSGDLAQDLRTVLGDLRTAGHGDVYRIDQPILVSEFPWLRCLCPAWFTGRCTSEWCPI